MHAHTHTHTHTHKARSYTHTHKPHIYTYVHTHTYTCMHTHKHAPHTTYSPWPLWHPGRRCPLLHARPVPHAHAPCCPGSALNTKTNEEMCVFVFAFVFPCVRV